VELKIRGDLHVHSSHNLCELHSPGDIVEYEQSCGRFALSEMVEVADASGLEYVAVVNHVTDPGRPTPPTPEGESKIARHRAEVDALNKQRGPNTPTHILAGVETSLMPGGETDASPAALSPMDVVILSRHAAPKNEPGRVIVEEYTQALRRYPIDVLGHPTRYIHTMTMGDHRVLMEQCVRAGVAFELNFKNPFGPELYAHVAATNVLVALGSDLHPENVDAVVALKRTIDSHRRLLEHVRASGVRTENILNTWKLSKLSLWRQERRSEFVRSHPLEQP
jgi:histidinol phosphatase-like PHP family hydrolase